jgi:hypothetical protein
MKALAHDIRKLLADRIQTATAADLFSIATSICANDEATRAPRAWTYHETSRFSKLDLRGNVTSTADYVAVYDWEKNLTWTRKPLECGAVSWKDAKTAASNYRLFGADGWRLPTLRERISIIDYDKFGPALYPEFDAGGASYEWTSTPDAESPSGCAWLVGLHFGFVLRGLQTSRYYVRAVRAGQLLSLGL